jgi:hypothetical protein
VQVHGVYNAGEKQIAVAAEPLGARMKYILSHEVTHALQDQHFNLAELIHQQPTNSDRDLAIRAVIEGDATVTARVFATLTLSASELGELRNGGASLGTPQLYQLGADFVQTLLTEGGWDAVNGVYSSPPQSTEQIMHPQKYSQREAPMLPGLPDSLALLGADWRLVREDTLGELELQNTLSQSVPVLVATQAAGGWGGDRYQLLERSGDGFLSLVLVTTWDSGKDAQEFFLAYADAVQARHGHRAVPQQNDARLKTWITPEGVVWLEGREGKVVVVKAPDLKGAERLAATTRD